MSSFIHAKNCPKYTKDTSAQIGTPFEQRINNIDNVRILGIEPSSVILSKTKYCKIWKVILK